MVLSLAMGAVGVLHAAALGIHGIGRGPAAAKGLNSKHATKQVDRLPSNGKVNIWRLVSLVGRLRGRGRTDSYWIFGKPGESSRVR